MSDTIFGSITKYAVAGAASTDAFAELREAAVDLIADNAHAMDPPQIAEMFGDVCRDAEDSFMETNYATDPDAKHTAGKRNGQWKYRTFLPPAYSSAKTEITKGIEAGLDIQDKGKSALAKERKAATSTPETDGEKIIRLTAALKRAILAVEDPDDRRAFRQSSINALTTS